MHTSVDVRARAQVRTLSLPLARSLLASGRACCSCGSAAPVFSMMKRTSNFSPSGRGFSTRSSSPPRCV
eukprot:5786398-Pleurochrysis_carterae.AAC.2